MGPVNCSGDIEVRVALDACVDGTRNSVFYYRNRASTGAPAFFEIEYQIDGGTWTNPKGAQTNNYYTAIQNGVEESVSVSVPSDSTISWRYKDTLSVNALSTKSFELATPTPLSVLCGGLLEHTVAIGDCVDRKASSTPVSYTHLTLPTNLRV